MTEIVQGIITLQCVTQSLFSVLILGSKSPSSITINNELLRFGVEKHFLFFNMPKQFGMRLILLTAETAKFEKCVAQWTYIARIIYTVHK